MLTLPTIGEVSLVFGVLLLFVWSVADGYHSMKFEEYKEEMARAAEEGSEEELRRVASHFYHDSRVDVSIELISIGSMFGSLLTIVGFILVSLQ